MCTHTHTYPCDMSQYHSSGVCTGERKPAKEGKRCRDREREQKSAWKSKAEVLLLHIPQMEISLLMFRGNRGFQTSQEQETGDQTQTLDMVVTARQTHSSLLVQYWMCTVLREERPNNTSH